MDTHTKQRLEANIWKIKLQFFLLNFFVYSPILFISFQEKGISLAGIGLILTISTVAGFLFEIPTGMLADRYGHKYMLALAGVAGIITMFLWTSHLYLALLAGMVVRSLVDSARSGADTALLYNTLTELKREREYTRHNGAKFSLGMIAFGAAGIAASLLPTGNFYLLHFLVTAVAFGFAMVLALSLQETKRHKAKDPPLAHLKESFSFMRRHHEVYKIVLYTAILSGSLLLVITQFQFFMKEAGMATRHFGFIYAAMGGISALASYHAHTIEQRLGERRILILLPGFFIAGTLFLIIGSSLWTLIAGFLLIEVMLGLQGAILNTYLQRHLEAHRRSTIESLSTFYGTFYKAIMYIVVGVIADVWSINAAASFVICVMLFLITPPTYFLVTEHRTRREGKD